jgi:FdhD protein
MVKNKLEPLECLLFTTGRVPTDMVRKAVAASIGGLVSKAVPTDAAIEMAEKYNLNLICKAWPDSFVIANQSSKK